MSAPSFKIGFFFAFAIFVLPLSFVIAVEFAFRNIWPNYSDGTCIEKINGPIGWKYKTNCSYSTRFFELRREIRFQFDSCGRRNEVDCHVQMSNQKLRRIATVGDSFALGAANNISEIYQTRLVNALGKELYSFDNYGVSAYDLPEYEEVLKRIIPMNYYAVVLTILPNDFFGDISEHEVSRRNGNSIDGVNSARIPTPKNRLKEFVSQSRVFSVVSHFLFVASDQVYFRLVDAAGRRSYIADPLSLEWREKVVDFDSFVKRLDPETAKKLIIVYIPQRAQVIASKLGMPGANKFPDTLKYSVMSNGIRFVDALPVFSAANEELYLPVDGHLNDRGAFLLGQLIASKM